MPDADTERFVEEPPKDTSALPGPDERNPYEHDRARVLHSAAFRRLAAKTQVHTAGTDDFLRTRLTHSLEVAQIAREMGARLGCDPDVAYSVHDVEDGIHSRFITLSALRDDGAERQALCADVAGTYSTESPSDLAAVLDELLEDPVLAPLSGYDGTFGALVALKQ